MTLQLKKATKKALRDCGFDEKWLQDRINEDPSLLGLGDELVVSHKEKKQAPGGRIDFVLSDEDDTRYVVELMLGPTDASHIIRTIEYWDIERQKNPTKEYRAVIVAEEITSRFFNVIRLLHRAVPLIAIQLSSLQVEGSVILHFTKVLDIWEEIGGEDDEGSDRADRHYWEEQASKDSLAAADKFVQLLKGSGTEPKVTYNRGRISVTTTGRIFCWLHPRKEASHCRFTVRLTNGQREVWRDKLDAIGIDAVLKDTTKLRFSAKLDEIDKNKSLFTELLKLAESGSGKAGADADDD